MWMIHSIFFMVSVSFFVLLERKFLGISQSRKGPNKSFFIGIAQSISDMVKLLSKEWSSRSLSSLLLFLFVPFMTMIFSLFLWMFLYKVCPSFYFSFSLFMIMIFLSLKVYPIMMSGWFSSSKYSLIGALRSLSQFISYEIGFEVSALVSVIYFGSISLTEFLNFSYFSMSTFFLLVPLVIYFCSALAESNRTPFDLVEGESELVSGFNTEFSSLGFVLLFLSELLSLMFISASMSVLFFSFSVDIYINFGSFIFFLSIISSMFIWVRASFPRFRYDTLMIFAWGLLVPLSIIILLFFSFFLFF